MLDTSGTTIKTEDGVELEQNARAFNYYDRKPGKIGRFASTGDPDQWFDFEHDDGTVSLLNGARICSVAFALRKGWMKPELPDGEYGLVGWIPVGVRCSLEDGEWTVLKVNACDSEFRWGNPCLVVDSTGLPVSVDHAPEGFELGDELSIETAQESLDEANVEWPAWDWA